MQEGSFHDILLRTAGIVAQMRRETQGLRGLLRRLPPEAGPLVHALGKGLDRMEQALSELTALWADLPAEVREPPVAPLSLDPAHILREEAEHQRLAKSLGEGPAQLLANAVVEMDAILPLLQAPKEVAKGLRQLRDELDEGLFQLRWLIWELEPPTTLRDLGLGATLEQFAQRFHRRTGIPVVCEGVEQLPDALPYTMELALFRIVQEALQNVYQHAKASQVWLGVAWTGEGLQLSVADDGRGFPQRLPSPSLGLISMQDRADLIGARLSVRSGPGLGTRVVVLLPRDLLEAMGVDLPASQASMSRTGKSQEGRP